MMKNPNIHVIIPVYNCEKYLEEAVASVLNQSYQNIDIVLVDDGSTDASPQLCDGLAEEHSRIHVIHQANAGVSAARNTGMEFALSRGCDYLAFLDGDDAWYPEFFCDEVMDILEKGYNCAGFQTVRCSNGLTRSTRAIPMQEGLRPGGAESVWINNTQTFGAAFYSAKVIAEYDIRFVQGLRVNEDIIFSMQFKYLAETIFLKNRVLYCYRNNQNSVSHTKRKPAVMYPPVMQAYLRSDRLMEKWQNETRGLLREGHAMAAVYVVEMSQEHYSHFGSKKELDRVFAEYPEFLELINSPFARNREDSGLKWQEIRKHPVKFRLRRYAIGAGEVLRAGVYGLAMKVPGIRECIEKLRYPIVLEQ